MEATILWEGIAWKSLEYCRISDNEGGIKVDSTIVGKAEDMYNIAYQLSINKHWEIIAALITGRIGNKEIYFTLAKDETGIWAFNNEPTPQFDGCLDIDISVTPLTNTLPIKRLQLAQDECREISVIYFDLFDNIVRPARQAYTKLSASTYRYENVPNNFEALIRLNEQMLVVDYPDLFRAVDYLNE